MTLTRTAVPCIAALLFGCGSADTTEDLTTPLPVWHLVEEVRIGAVDGGNQNLSRVNGLLPLPDGGVWIVQPAESLLRAYDHDGKFRATIGREGRGPGEFVGPSRMGWWRGGRDTIWVYDLQPRMSLFRTDGTLIRDFVPERVEYQERWIVRRPEIVLADGSAIGVASKQQGEELNDYRVVRYGESANPPTEIARISRAISVRYDLQFAVTATIPIPDAELVAYAPNGRWLVVADRRAQGMPPVGRLPVHAIGTEGDTLWSRTFDYAPLPLQQSEIDSTEARRQFMRTFHLERGRSKETVAQRTQLITLPDHRPPVDRVLIGEDDTVWLEWAAPPGQHGDWLVLSSSGDPVATVEHPLRLDAYSTSRTTVWAVELDALDVPYVVRYRVVESKSSNTP
jgi:hypothetical protein